MQPKDRKSSAALEAEVWEVTNHGPGHHLGSDRIDHAGHELLAPLAEMIDGQDVLSRYDAVLHLLKKPPLARGAQPAQDAAAVVRLRNEIVHYKSRWGVELDASKLFTALKKKQHAQPPFVAMSGVNFFPHQCLSAACAAWVVDSAVAYLDAFYDRLGIPSPLASDRSSLNPRV